MPEADQDEMTAYVRDICPHCGNLRSVCSNPETTWFPQRTMCYGTAVRDLTVRQVAKKYGSPGDGDELHPTDGMSVWASTADVNPDDDFV